MEYTGKLYGKIGRRHIPLTLTSEDVDRLEQWKGEAMQVLATMNKRDFKAGIEAAGRVIAEYHKLNKENGSPASACSPRCDNCRWGSELEERYDQRHCINEESPEAFGNVEAASSCHCFEANAEADSSAAAD